MKIDIKQNIRKIDTMFLEREDRKYLSPAYLSQFEITLPLIQEYVRGDLLDLGCGDMPYQKYIQSKITKYDSIDFTPRTKQVTFVGDIQDMGMVQNSSYDSAICLEVLEHLPNPDKGLKEINRILKDKGVLIISVPHLSRLHDEPYDFYRYTRYGLISMLEGNGFQVVSLRERGGLFCFLGHQFCLGLIGITGGMFIIREFVFFINRLISIFLYNLDKWLNTTRLFPLGYSLVAQKYKAM